MTKLKAKSPDQAEPTKPKMTIFGPAGVGKTWFVLGFPSVFYVSPEPGATRKHYTDRLKASGGVYLGPEDGAMDFEVLIEQTKALATEKHKYKTLVFDSITEVFNGAIAKEAERLGAANAFGADKKPAIANMRRLLAAVARLDMNVIFVAHEKSEWGVDANGNRAEIGKIPDAWEKLMYSLDLAFQCQKRGANRVAVTRKSRLIGFPENESFPLDFEEFAKRYGKDIIEKEAVPVAVASEEQVKEIVRLVELLKVDKDASDKWLEKAGVETFAEFNTEQASKIIASLETKLKK